MCCLPQGELGLIHGKHLPRPPVGVLATSIADGVADQPGALPAVVTAGDGDIAAVTAEVNGVSNVFGLGGRPQVRLIHPDTQGFATPVFPDDPLPQLTTVLDHECHPVGRDRATLAIGLPGEAAIAVWVRDRSAPDPASVCFTADDLCPEAVHRTRSQR